MEKIDRSKMMAGLVGIGACAAVTPRALAQTWPSRPRDVFREANFFNDAQ